MKVPISVTLKSGETIPIAEYCVMPSGSIVVRLPSEGAWQGESLWFDSNGEHPKSKLNFEDRRPSVDLEGALLECLYWKPTGDFRWRRPARSTDDEKVLEQLWERVSGERQWRPISVMLED